MPYGIIYKATNLINGKIYIGQTTKKLEERKKGHLKDAKNKSRKGCLYFKNSLNKYGFDNFKWEEIDTAENLDELNKKELFHINDKKSNNKKFGYNLKGGGDSLGRILEESREKIGKSNKEFYKNNPEARTRAREKTIEQFKDPIKKEKHREAISLALKKPDVKEKMSKSQKERFKNPEEIKKNKERRIKFWSSEEKREEARQRAIKQFSDKETRQNISIRVKEFYKNNPEAIEKLRKDAIEQFKDLEKRKEVSEKLIEHYKNSENIEKARERSLNFFKKNPEAKLKAREKAIEQFKDPEARLHASRLRGGKEIFALNLKTKEIKKFDYLAEASREIKTQRSSIRKVLQGKMKQTKGWIFSYTGEFKNE